VFDFPGLAKFFQGLEDFFGGVTWRIPMQPVKINIFNAEALEVRIEIRLTVVPK
jgi:hypothetical protein